LAKEVRALSLGALGETGDLTLVTTMLETTITLLAIVCSACVATMCLMRWHRSNGYKAAVYLAVAAFSGLVALLNLSGLVASDTSFIRTATLAYVGFATAIVLPAARALGNLTYETPHQPEKEDAAI
jgi:hypothetical protein